LTEDKENQTFLFYKFIDFNMLWLFYFVVIPLYLSAHSG